jgi:23S rRNA (pseudouridine1915-N3)-methyltransferase
MLKVTLICVGKLKEPFYAAAVKEYTKRLRSHCKLEIIELTETPLPASPSQAQIDGALAAEADAIQNKLPKQAAVIAMCIEGTLLSSPELARRVQRWSVSGVSHLALLIGGSYGLDPSLKRQAALRLSMSPMTFPHHLARVMVLEQIYRAFKINEGSPYHK